MQFFFEENILKTKKLSAEDSKHCIKVLRKRKGDTIDVVDGHNNLYSCGIVQDSSSEVKLEIHTVTENYDRDLSGLVLAISATKNMDRIEWMLEKAVEIGIRGLILINTDHTVHKFAKTERLKKIAISAMKQSLKASLPFVKGPVSLKELIGQGDFSQLLVCHQHIENLPMSTIEKKENTLMLVGPEGDFSKEEINFVAEKGGVFVSLGNSRLRTETAGLVAVTLFKNT